MAPELLPSGNASHTYSAPIDRARGYSAQLDKIGVGILARVPIYLEPVLNWETMEYDVEKNVTFEEIEVDFVCLSAGDAGDSQSQDEDESDGVVQVLKMMMRILQRECRGSACPLLSQVLRSLLGSSKR
jgi:hypothetical protein